MRRRQRLARFEPNACAACVAQTAVSAKSTVVSNANGMAYLVKRGSDLNAGDLPQSSGQLTEFVGGRLDHQADDGTFVRASRTTHAPDDEAAVLGEECIDLGGGLPPRGKNKTHESESFAFCLHIEKDAPRQGRFPRRGSAGQR